MIRRAIIGLGMFLANSVSAAEITSPHADAMTATLYQSYRGKPDIALIAETRQVDLPAGENVIRFDDVAASLIPQTAQLGGLPEPPRESDFDFDLFDTATLLRKSLGQPVMLIQTPPKSAALSRSGTLVSQQGMVAFADAAGVETLGCGGPSARLVLTPPAGLRSKPALSVHLRTARAGRYTLQLSYLAEKLRWKAVYVARIAKGRQRLDLEGRIVLTNATETSFDQVPTRFIAGDIARLQKTRAPETRAKPFARDCWTLGRTSDPVIKPENRVFFANSGIVAPMMSALAPAPMMAKGLSADMKREVVLENLGDLKLFRLEEPVRIAAHQEKQFTFMNAKAVKTAAVYLVRIGDPEFDDDADRRPLFQAPAPVIWRVRNVKASGLGKPLPHGAAILYGTGAFLGFDQIASDVAEGESFDLTGPADGGVTFDKIITADTETGSAHDRSYAVTLRNTTGHAVAVALRLPQRPGRAILSGLPGVTAKAGAFVWPTTLAAHQTKTLSVVIREIR